MNAFFMVSNEYASEYDCSDEMWQAFQKCQGVSPQWIKENKCLDLRPKSTDILVLEEFEGKVFEKFQTKCLIRGPKCFLTNEPISKGTGPILNTAMQDVVACLCGFIPEDKLVYQQR